MRTIFTSLFICISLFSFSQVRISQVYGGGGNSAVSTYDHDFVELFNAGTSAADISNWSIQYASAAGPVAPGDWAVVSIPAATTIGAGKYFLIELATGGANGIALPTPDLINTSLNISNTSGKVALLNNNTALNGTTACSNASVVDVIGYGAAATCFETAFAITAGIDNSMSQLRGSNGCDETNNNSNDFSIGTVNPRNSASAANSCGTSPALLTALPVSLNIYSTVGINSNTQSYNLSGLNLTGFPGNISVAASAGLQVSLSSGSGFAASINVPYTSATLTNTLIYVRIAATAPQGIMNGSITNSGGGATSSAIVTIGGGVYQDYYNTKANNGLNVVSTWSSTPDGLGFSPVDFTTPFQAFNIINQTNASYSGVWDVSDAIFSPRVIVGDGTNPINLTIFQGIDSITMATRVNVLNNGTLTILNNRRPFLNNLATGSTVDFAQTGTSSSDTIRIPNISFYNLKLTGGLKYFSPAITTVRGDFTADGVVSMNGSAPVFSTINAQGDVSFINGTQFEPLPSGAAARITLAMNGSGTQNITGQRIHLFRLQRDSTSSNSIINATGHFILGNFAGGGLRLNQGASTTTALNMQGIFPFPMDTLTFIGAAVSTPSAMGKINSTGGAIILAKSTGNSNAGVLRFTSGSQLFSFTTVFDPAFTRDSIMIADTVIVGQLNLIKGRIVVESPAALTISAVNSILTGHGNINGGSEVSFVDGKLRRAGTYGVPADTSIYPLGQGDKYAPVEVIANNPTALDLSIQYFFSGYGNYTIDPTTLATYPDYNVSRNEYWVLNDAIPAFPLGFKFHYTDTRSGVLDPTQVKIAHFDGTDWNDVGGTADAANTTSNGFVLVNNVTDFSPFTFSARITGVLPVRLTDFTAQKQNKTVKLNWSTSQEINSSHFIVQRSTDGRTWKDIATVNAAGNSNIKLNYSTTDNDPVNGINFYRLKEVDTNGKFDVSETRTVLFSSEFEISVTPNPATDFINIYISKDNNSISSIVIMDANGKRIKKFSTTESSYKIDAGTFAPGVYFISVMNEGKLVTKKIVIY